MLVLKELRTVTQDGEGLQFQTEGQGGQGEELRPGWPTRQREEGMPTSWCKGPEEAEVR